MYKENGQSEAKKGINGTQMDRASAVKQRNFVPNFIAMATRESRGKISLAAFDGLTLKTWLELPFRLYCNVLYCCNL